MGRGSRSRRDGDAAAQHVSREASISTGRPIRINERIRIPEIRLIDENGTHVGVLRTRDALEMARERGLDLVEVQPNAVPPVCRLMDYGKFRYEESRRERESRKRQKTADVKEIRLSPKIGEHDLETKGRLALKFLEAGDKVKLTVRFRGREMAHQDIGRSILERMAQDFGPAATVDQVPHIEGRTMVMMLSPAKGARGSEEQQQAAEAQRLHEGSRNNAEDENEQGRQAPLQNHGHRQSHDDEGPAQP
ncbi:MAG TPA: translation initiation factor IF-3 [Thermomicrobiaceae bacterium]|nr:translation initiation factor IF-3 [Thermomicrobiaceae bacterium]